MPPLLWIAPAAAAAGGPRSPHKVERTFAQRIDQVPAAVAALVVHAASLAQLSVGQPGRALGQVWLVPVALQVASLVGAGPVGPLAGAAGLSDVIVCAAAKPQHAARHLGDLASEAVANCLAEGGPGAAAVELDLHNTLARRGAAHQAGRRHSVLVACRVAGGCGVGGCASQARLRRWLGHPLMQGMQGSAAGATWNLLHTHTQQSAHRLPRNNTWGRGRQRSTR